ncbi:MAG: hypothetical protein KDH96_12000, partial [Candidatus Riesia sp.]|nr:hypothetical protein [Candidatus Riesia sp.]
MDDIYDNDVYDLAIDYVNRIRSQSNHSNSVAYEDINRMNRAVNLTEVKNDAIKDDGVNICCCEQCKTHRRENKLRGMCKCTLCMFHYRIVNSDIAFSYCDNDQNTSGPGYVFSGKMCHCENCRKHIEDRNFTVLCYCSDCIDHNILINEPIDYDDYKMRNNIIALRGKSSINHDDYQKSHIVQRGKSSINRDDYKMRNNIIVTRGDRSAINHDDYQKSYGNIVPYNINDVKYIAGGY